VDECKPLVPGFQGLTGEVNLDEVQGAGATADWQGLTLVHVRAQLEQLQDTFMS